MELQEAAEEAPPIPATQPPILNASQPAAEAQLTIVPRTEEPGSGEHLTTLIGAEALQTAAITTMATDVR